MRALSCLVAITVLVFTDVARAQDARKVVLMLSEFRPDSQASTDREEIIRSTLTQALREGVDYYAEFIDIKSGSSGVERERGENALDEGVMARV